MDLARVLKEQGLEGFPAGLGGCRGSGGGLGPCGYDIVVFDGTALPSRFLRCGDSFAVIRHASLSESDSARLLGYDGLRIISDESWELRMLLSRIRERRDALYRDLARSSLVESMMCCQRARDSLGGSGVFASCWQKCAAYYLADAVSALNGMRPSPTHMLASLRNLGQGAANEHVGAVSRSIGIERATPTLLDRMSRSTTGFSDAVEGHGHSEMIRLKHDHLVGNSMLADCYFYLGYVNRDNFASIRDRLHREPDLAHVLKIAFDADADPGLVLRNADLLQESCKELLGAAPDA